MIRGRSSFDRSWKKEFFFISGNWDGDPSDVNNAPFPSFTSALGCFHPEGTSFILYFVFSIYFFPCLTMSFINAAITHPHLDKFYLKHINRTRAHPERSFHSLVTFRHLTVWGLGPEPIEENLAHEETTRQSKCRLSSFIFLKTFIFPHHKVSHHEG